MTTEHVGLEARNCVDGSDSWSDAHKEGIFEVQGGSGEMIPSAASGATGVEKDAGPSPCSGLGTDGRSRWHRV